MVNSNITKDRIKKLLERVPDPEIPVLSIIDLGVFRKVEEINNHFDIYITPTYTGCPAMGMIEEEIRKVLKDEEIENFSIKTVLFPTGVALQSVI